MIKVPQAFVLLFALVPAQVAAECLNDDTFKFFYDGRDRPCTNIRLDETRRTDTCGVKEVSEACPQSCGKCCEDDDTFVFTRTNNKKGDCEWLAEKAKRVKRYCGDITKGFPSSNGGTIRNGCPVTCNFCFDPVALATVSPAPTITASGAPSGTPSGVPTGGPSAVPTGMPSPTPTEEPTRPPSPMPSPFPTLRPTSEPSNSPSDLPSIYPSETPSMMPSDQPSDVPSKMPSDMPSMVPSDQPSDVPSKMPSDQPSDVPSMVPSDVPSMMPSDQPSDVPSKMPSDVPSMLPSKVPSDQPSNNPTMSIKPSPLPSAAPVGATDAPTEAPVAPACVNDPDFTWVLTKDKTTQKCTWLTGNKRVDLRRKNYCGEADIAAACPQGCGTCIADDPDFSFKLRKQKKNVGCEWLTRNADKIATRLKYCDFPKIAAGCAESCA